MKLSQQTSNGSQIMPLNLPGGSTLLWGHRSFLCACYHLLLILWRYAHCLSCGQARAYCARSDMPFSTVSIQLITCTVLA